MSMMVPMFMSNNKRDQLRQKAKPIVTIGICVRNCEKYINEVIESIIRQDYPHNKLELIFVDDGSEDKTLRVIEECVSSIDMPSKVFRSSWKGIGHARNIVIKNANGDYILWVDGDMVLSQGFVGKLVDFMDQNAHVGIAKGKQNLELEGGYLSTLESCARAASRMVNYQSEKTRSRALGAGGAIYRVTAIKQVGGFDENLRGYGEDLDIELRMRNAGWSLFVVDCFFSDYERYKLTWTNLWRKYWLRGYYSHYFFHKHNNLLKHYRMLPIAAFIAGLIQSQKIYRLTKKKLVFLLPIEFFFKTSAWYIGFIKSHINSYQPVL